MTNREQEIRGKLSRRELTVAVLLERWDELGLPVLGSPGDSGDGRILRADHDADCAWTAFGRPCTCWVESRRELERCLGAMRKLRKQVAVRYVDKDGKERSDDIGVVLQHVRWWFLEVTWRSQPSTRIVVVKGGQRKAVQDRDKRILVATRHQDARVEKAYAGVRFLSSLMRVDPRLPREVASLVRAAA